MKLFAPICWWSASFLSTMTSAAILSFLLCAATPAAAAGPEPANVLGKSGVASSSANGLRLLYAGPSTVVIGEGASFVAEFSVRNASNSTASPAGFVKVEATGVEIVGESVFQVGALAPASGVGPFRIHVKASKQDGERGVLKLFMGGAASPAVEINFEMIQIKNQPSSSQNQPLAETYKFNSLNGNSDWLLQGASGTVVKNGSDKGVEIEVDRRAEFVFGGAVDDPKKLMVTCGSGGGVTATAEFSRAGEDKFSVVFKPPQEFSSLSLPLPRSVKGVCKLTALRVEGAGKFSIFNLSILSGKPVGRRVVLYGQRFHRGRDIERRGLAIELGSPMQVAIADGGTADLMVTFTPSKDGKLRPLRRKPLSGVGKSGMRVIIDNPDCVGLYDLKVESAALASPYSSKLFIAASEAEITKYFQDGDEGGVTAPKTAPEPQLAKRDDSPPPPKVAQAQTTDAAPVGPKKPEPLMPMPTAKVDFSPQELVFYFPTPGNIADNMRPSVDDKAAFDNPLLNVLDRGVVDPDIADYVGVNDCLEGVNRTLFGFNVGLMKWVFRPVGMVYASMFPRCAVNAIGRCSKNMEWPARLFACLLQAKFAGAGEESLRFLVNTTLGVVGLFDPAGEWLGLQAHDEDFGQAFASWGIGMGCYLVLPLQGPTSLRDAVGLIFDSLLDPKTYIPYGGSWLFRINSGALNYGDFRLLVDANKDPYVLAKQLWVIARQLKIAD